jgi:ABC-2 type transport system permease protein
MLSVLKNNYCRMLQRLPAVLIMTVITLVSIILAIYITGTQQVKGHIVYVSQTSPTTVSSKYLSVVTMTKEPPYSSLVKQQYDAFVIDNGNGRYDIKTLKSEDYKKMIEGLLKNPNVPVKLQNTDRGVGENIIGFMMMFLLMSTFMNLFTFADDKEQNQLARIASSPIRFSGYLAAHCIYCLSMFLPEYLMLVIMKLLGFDIGFSLLQYALLYAVIGFFGISLALLLHTLIKKPDNANMLGNSILVLSSVLAGSFYSFSKGNAVLDNVVKVLPQKQLLDFAHYLQNGDAFAHIAPLLYIIVFSAALFAVSCVILTRKYVKKI